MKLTFIIPTLCLSLLTSHADETRGEPLKPPLTRPLTVDKVTELTPAPLLGIPKGQPFWIQYSFKAKLSF
jgi:hypothetical protein